MSEPVDGGNVIPFPAATAPIHTPQTTEQIERHVSTLLELTKLVAFRGDLERQALAFEHMGVLWPQLTDSHRINIRARVTEALNITETRFDYLIKATSATDLRIALEWRRVPFERQVDERIYPDHSDGWLGRYLAYAEAGEAHLGWHFWSGLFVLASACRRNFFLVEGHQPLFPNFYVLLEGDSGSGKTTAISRARQLLSQMNTRLMELSETDLLRLPTVGMLPERLTLRAMFDSFAEISGCRRLVGPMRAIEIPADYETVGALVCSELSWLMGKGNTDSGQLIVALTTAYDGRVEDSTHMHGHIVIENLTLSALFGSTMTWLRSNITPEIFQGGFMGARCLVVPKQQTGRSYPDEPLVDPIQRAALVEHLCWLAHQPPTRMVLSPAADATYKLWYDGFAKEASEDDRINGYYRRRKVYIKKLSMLFAISRGHIPTITGKDMEDALALLRWEEPGMLGCFRQMVCPNEAGHNDWIINIIQKAGGKIMRSDLSRRVSSRLNRTGMEECLLALKGQGLMAEVTLQQSGSPKATWYYMPDVWTYREGSLVRTGGG